MNYFVKTPWWLKRLYPKRLWSVDTTEKIIYLSFDDGPHPVATPFILDTLKSYNARASFFCIGKNVAEYPAIYQRILAEGHRTGNHTMHHSDGWKTPTPVYLEDVNAASAYIDTDLFRPPYGRLRSSQAKGIASAMGNRSVKIVMWSVLSGDFDPSLSKEKCLENVTRNIKPGSILVFHDSEKAFTRLEYVLPRFLQSISAMGYRLDHL